MSPTRKAATNWLSAVLISFLSLYASAQSAGNANKFSAVPGNPSCRFFDGFADNGNGTVTDPRNGLVWKRCTEGFEWSGSQCVGSNFDAKWHEAMQAAKSSRFLGKSDWRLPSKAEFETVIGSHKAADRELCARNEDKQGQYAASRMIVHAINSDGNPGYYWTTSPSLDERSHSWGVKFSDGYFSVGYRNGYAYSSVRLVRSSQSSGGVAALEFQREYAKIDEYKKIKAHNDNEAQERRDQAARDEQYRRDAPARQARQMCEAQKQTCFASCPQWRDGANNYAAFSCEKDCQKISCN